MKMFCVTEIKNNTPIKHGFKTWTERKDFLIEVLESVGDLKEEGIQILVSDEEETPTKGSL